MLPISPIVPYITLIYILFLHERISSQTLWAHMLFGIKRNSLPKSIRNCSEPLWEALKSARRREEGGLGLVGKALNPKLGSGLGFRVKGTE